MNVVILTEGSNKKGLGHIIRCKSLYQSFKLFNVNIKIIVNGDDSLLAIIKDLNYEIFNWIKNKNKLFEIINTNDIVIIDSYIANLRDYIDISKKSSFCVFIDDNNRINYPNGIILNGLPSAKDLNYPKSENKKYFIGSEYILLRKDFWDIPDKKINNRIKEILITFGGEDIRNLTFKTLNSLEKNYPTLNKNVIVNNKFKDIVKIKKIKSNKINLIYSPDACEMINTMLKSDLAISAGGQTLYELCRVGVPPIAIGIIENQENNLNYLGKEDFVEYIGYWDDDKLMDKLNEKIDLFMDSNFRKEKINKVKKLSDGKGSIRASKKILHEYYEKFSIFRLAEEKDCLNIFNISNSKEVRNSSFNKSKLDLDNHKKWFFDKLRDNNHLFFVLEYETDLIGQTRLNLENKSATISISLNKKYTGLGLANLLINKSILYIKKNNKNISTVKAYIKDTNEKSVKLFENSGFLFEKNLKIEGNNSLEYLYKIRDV